MDNTRSEHPDEGTIHAWLDGALDDATAQALAAHVATCRDCAEQVAEARGLIAGATRVVGALDDASSAVGPAWGQAADAPVVERAGRNSAWRMLRVTPARAAIAATVLVALGVSLTYSRTALDTETTKAMRREPAAQTSAAPEERTAAPSAAPTIQSRDALLDSAVARNLAAAQPRRMLKPTPGPALPVPDAGAASAAAVSDRAATTRVAVGRAAVQAQRESAAGSAADQSRAGRAAGRAAGEPTVAAAKRADSIATPPMLAMPASAPVEARVRTGNASPGAECYRVESANGAPAAWGTVALPLVVAVDAGGRGARVLTPAGQDTDARASLTRAGDDSLMLRLRRIGFEGTLVLGAAGETRAGVMRSRPLQRQLESVVSAAAPTTDAPAERRAAARSPVRKSAPAAPDAAVAAAERTISGAPAVPVVARRISCPG